MASQQHMHQRSQAVTALPRYFCPCCERETIHGNISQSAKIAQVTRATIYNWKRRDLLHGVVRPSGRSYICINSLLRSQV